jgi:hypothetical protein
MQAAALIIDMGDAAGDGGLYRSVQNQSPAGSHRSFIESGDAASAHCPRTLS